MSDIANVVKEEKKNNPGEIKKEIPIILYRKGRLFLNELKENKRYNLEVSNEASLLKKYFLNKKEILDVLLPLGLETILNYKIKVKEVNDPSVILVKNIKSRKGREIKLSRLDKDIYYRLKFYYPGSGTSEFRKLEFQELSEQVGRLEEKFGERHLNYYVVSMARRKK